MSSENSTLVKLNNAGFKQNDKWLVEGVSLTVEKGKIVTLIGPNGSGKSTTAKIALGIYKNIEGSVEKYTNKVGYVPQKISIDWTLPLRVYDFMLLTEDIKEGCSIMGNQAEQLKVKFGSAWPGENKETEIVAIPGLLGRDPKEISLKTLSKIINARVVEIIEQVYLEIKNYGNDEAKKKLIGGIVLTGGGSQLKHLKQLVEYVTGMDTRIGFPGQHLAGDTKNSSPILSTAVGLVMKAIENNEKNENEPLIGDKTSEERKTVLAKWSEQFKMNFEKFIQQNTDDN